MRPHNIYKNILVVEGDSSLNHQVCKQFTAVGFTCEGATSVSEAYVLLGKPLVPDLVILDLQLNDGKGTEILGILAQPRFAHTKTIVLFEMGYSPHDKLDRYKIDHLLLKPIVPRQLAMLAGHLLDVDTRVWQSQTGEF